MKRTLALLLLSSALTACGMVPAKDGAGGEDSSAAAPAADPTSYTQAPGSHLQIKGAQAGYYLATRSAGADFQSESSIAIVADGGSVWHVELEGPGYKGYVMGLVVEKETGRITRAVLGKPGEAGKEITIPESSLGDDSAPDAVEEEVTISIGSFASRKVVVGDTTSWTGTEGDLEGVLLKVDNPAMGPYELERMPETAEVAIGSDKVSVVKLRYSNGSEFWDTDHAVVKALQPYGFAGKGRLKTIYTKPVKNTTAVDSLATNRKPQLMWE